MQKVSGNIKDTERIAKAFLSNLLKIKNKEATVVGLSGDLGVGKTAFTQMIAKLLGIKERVNSPTFVIMKKYVLPLPRGSAQRARGSKTNTPPNPPLRRGGANFKYLFHLDAYRLKNHKELLILGWEEIIKDKNNLVFIEWPENVVKAMPKNHTKISISHLPTGKAGTKDGHRSFKIKGL